MDANHRKILEMLAAEKISVADAERLMDKLTVPEKSEATAEAAPAALALPAAPAKSNGANPRYLRVVVNSHDGDNVNVRVPMALIRTGIKLGALMPKNAREAVEAQGVDLSNLGNLGLDELPAALAELNVDITDKSGDTVRVFCE